MNAFTLMEILVCFVVGRVCTCVFMFVYVCVMWEPWQSQLSWCTWLGNKAFQILVSLGSGAVVDKH